MKIVKAVILFLVPAAIFAQGHFRINPLQVKGEIQEVVAEDLDQDGLKELVVIHHIDSTDSARRFMTIFWPDPKSSYSPANSFVMELPGRYSIYDFGALPGEKEEVVLLLSKNTAEYFRWTSHKLEGPTRLVSFGNQLIQLTDSDRLLNYDCFCDWNRDGANELLTIGIGEAELFYYKEGSWQKVEMELPVEVSYFSMPSLRSIFPHSEVNVTYRTPNLFQEDRDADGKLELFAVSGNKIWIYKLDADGAYGEKPAYKLAPKVADFAPRERRRSQLNLQVTDFDGDNRADLVASYQRGSFFNQKSELKVYLGKSGWAESGVRNLKPDWSSSFDAWLIGPFFRKIANSRDRLMVVPIIASGFLQAVKVMVVHDFPLEVKYYTPQNHLLPALPTNTDTVSLSIDLSQGKMLGGFPQIFADFNGDGIDDLIYGKNEQELAVVLKDSAGKRTDRQEIISVPVAIFPVTDDLNHDKKDDIILVYSNQESAKNPGEFNVLLNQGGW